MSVCQGEMGGGLHVCNEHLQVLMAQFLPAAVRSWGVQPAELLVPHGRAQTSACEPKISVVQSGARLLHSRMENSSVALST